MLRFIVLGEIPGTHFVITFSWVLVATLLLLSAGELSVIFARTKTTTKSNRSTQLQLAKLIGRTTAALPISNASRLISQLVRSVRPDA